MHISYYCNSCDFELNGGHNHHNGFSRAVCKSCMTQYILPTEEPMGPSISEIIKLKKVNKLNKKHRKNRKNEFYEIEEYIPTNQEIMVEDSGEKYFRANYPIETVMCEECNSTGSIVLSFEKDEKCPKCKAGKILYGSINY